MKYSLYYAAINNNLPTLETDPAGNQIQTSYHPQFSFLPEYVMRLSAGVAIGSNKMVYFNVTNTFVSGSVTYTNLARGLLQRKIRAVDSTDAATNEWAYDGRGFIAQSVRYTGTADPAVTNSYFYSDRGELLEQTDASGRKTKFEYDPTGRPCLREVYEAAQVAPMAWEYSYYNANGELTWSDGPRYNPEDYVWRDYDGAGHPITEIRWRSEASLDGSGVEAPTGDALFATTFREYDPFGNLKRTIDPRGAISTNAWDALGRLVQRKSYDLDGTTLLSSAGFAYEPGGQVRYQTNALNGVTETQYTSTGQPKFRLNADGATNGWRYYLDGRAYRVIQGNGAYWQSAYDDVNRTVTRVFYSASDSALATNVTASDRRGNAILTVDAEGNMFTNVFDGLDRLKLAAGPVIETVLQTGDPLNPVYVTNYSRQLTAHLYDGSGRVTTVTNALGEKTVTTCDALGRTTSVEIYAAGAGAPLRVTSTSYSADHNATTVTAGSGGNAIVNTAYTDNNGNPVLSLAYPSANAREFTRRQYDLNGNQIYEERDSATNGTVSAWSGTVSSYDGLNRLVYKLDRDNAATTYAYDAAGNLTNRVMPGGLQWCASYNNAGKMLKDWSLGAGGAGTRTNSYGYYALGSPFAGLLQTRTDGAGVVCSYLYDDYLRIASSSHVSPVSSNFNIDTFWTYDARGLLTSVDETFPNTYESAGVTYAYDAYGQVVFQATENSSTYVSADQAWDAAGRRTGLSFWVFPYYAGREYSYSWLADGSLASVTSGDASAIYSYTSAGILTNRTAGSRSTTIGALDGVGRPLSITTTASLSTKATEMMAWTGDGLLNSHTVTREDFTDARSYDYASLSRRLIGERLNLDGAKRWTNSFAYDNGVASGPGALTKVGPVSGAAQWGASMDAFSRLNTETNTYSLRSAYGRANGPSTITALLDGLPVPVVQGDSYGTNWPINWRATLPLSTGAHQLSVTAQHPSGMFSTNATSAFTNNAAYESAYASFDAVGRITQRIWKSSNGTTNRTENLTWDVKGRFWSVVVNDMKSGNGYEWYASYDPLGRRMDSQTVNTTNGLQTGFYTFNPSYYDPSIEFLELGVGAPAGYSGSVTWKLYGPDLNGRYGGMNGVGGLEGTVSALTSFQPTLSDARGNVLLIAA